MAEYYCSECGRRYPATGPRWRCDCGSPFDLSFDVRFPLDLLSGRPPDIWRYREALPPVEMQNIVSLGEGFTPLIAVTTEWGRVYAKLDFLMPSGSFKDRGASVLMSRVKQLGVEEVVIDSSGNAAAAMACYAAHARVRCRVFVPASTSAGKLVQMRAYGAEVVAVPGSREDTARAVLEAAETTYYASHYWNPYFFEGAKTFAYEVWEQLGLQAPDTVILPVGNGTYVLGAYIGFSDLKRAGIIRDLPKIIAVQARAVAPIWEAYTLKLPQLPPVTDGKTMAEGIAIRNPVRWKEIIGAVEATAGDITAVTEEEIKNSLREWGKRGIFMEPTSAVVTAAHSKLSEAGVDLGETVVLAISGSGLKATDKLKAVWE